MAWVIPVLEREDGAVWVTGTQEGPPDPGVLLAARPRAGEDAARRALRALAERHGVEGREAREDEAPLDDGTRLVRVASWRGRARNGWWWWPHDADREGSPAHARLIARYREEEEAVRRLAPAGGRPWMAESMVIAVVADHEGRILACGAPNVRTGRGWTLPRERAYEMETMGECLNRMMTEQMGIGVLWAQTPEEHTGEAEENVALVRRWAGTPRGWLGQRLAWVGPEEGLEGLGGAGRAAKQTMEDGYRACQAR